AVLCASGCVWCRVALAAGDGSDVGDGCSLTVPGDRSAGQGTEVAYEVLADLCGDAAGAAVGAQDEGRDLHLRLALAALGVEASIDLHGSRPVDRVDRSTRDRQGERLRLELHSPRVLQLEDHRAPLELVLAGHRG